MILALVSSGLVTACNGGGTANDSTPEFESVVRYKIGNGIFTGTLKRGQPYTGSAESITFASGVYTGSIESGDMFTGVGNQVQFNNKKYQGKYSGTVLFSDPDEGTATNLCKQQLSECFTGEIFNSNYFQGELTKAGKTYNIVLGAPSNGYSKQSQHKNQFESYLEIYESSPTIDNLTQVVLGRSGQASTLSYDQKIDINNDDIRRFFETALAKNMLISIVKDTGKYQHLRLLTNNLMNFEVFALSSDGMKASTPRPKKLRDRIKQGKTFLGNWNLASKGLYSGKDTTFRQLSLTINRYTQFLRNPELGLNNNEQKLILDMFKVHYLQYKIQLGPMYKIYADQHGEILDIYNSHPYYKKRGRMDLGIFRKTNSRHMGILRNVDVGKPGNIYMDNNKPIYSIKDPKRDALETRCPDRFDMDTLDAPENSGADSWLVHNFDNGVSPVINGLSGSMLSEIRFMLFAKDIVRNAGDIDSFELNSFKIKSDFLTDPQDMINYFRIVNSLFIYFEGGHSLYEVNTPFEIKEIKDELNEAFFDGSLKDLSMKSVLITGNESSVQKATLETLDFYRKFDRYKQQMDRLKKLDPLSWN